MFDSLMRRVIDPPLKGAARLVVAGDIPANAVTMLGFCFALACFTALAVGFYGAALVFLALNRVMDGLDGPVARASPRGATDFGGYLDIVTDFVFYGGFVFFFAVGQPQYALAASFLLFSFMASGPSFLAAAIIAEKRGLKTTAQGEKSFYYMAGLAEGTETVIAFILICLFPYSFETIALIFGTLCLLSAAGRLLIVKRACRTEPHVNDDTGGRTKRTDNF